MNFDYDIFICYAGAGKNSTLDNPDWPANFSRYLEIVLQRLLKRKPVMVLHDDLRARENDLGDNTAQFLEQTAIFITILSPGNVNDEQYLIELEKIEKAVSKHTGDTEIRHRILKVLTGYVSTEQQPLFLRDKPGYNFFEINRFNKKSKTYPADEQESGERFWSKIVDLAYDIHDQLKGPGNNNSHEKTETSKGTVFLAGTSHDQEENRDIIRRELLQSGFKIVPSFELPDDTDKLNELIRSYLDNAVLSVHIMGAYYGSPLPKSQYSLIDMQNRIVKEYIEENSTPVERIIWIPNDLKTSEQRQSLFLNRMKRDDTREQTEIIEAPLEVLKSIIHKKLKDRENGTGKKNKHTSVYMIYEEKTDYIDRLIAWLGSNNLDVITSDNNESETKVVTRHRENIVHSDAVLICKENSETNWFDSKFRDLIKSPGYGKNDSFMAIGLISGSEIKMKHELPGDVVILDREDSFDKSMKPFLDKLQKQR